MTRTWEQVGIDPSLLHNPNGEQKIPCPRCRPTSKHPERRCLNVNTATGEWNCWNDGEGCGFKGSLNAPERGEDLEDFEGPPSTAVIRRDAIRRSYRRITKDEYLRRTKPLPPEAIDWLKARGFSDEVISGCGLRWGTVTKDSETQQWIQGIFYPYVVRRDNETYIANVKKRCLCCKDHMQLMGRDADGTPCELVFWGLANTADTVVVVEGEPDGLACMTAGIKNVWSVPNGATLKSDTARLSYLDACERETRLVKHFILALDDDQPGRLLKQELARRLGFRRCSYVVYPEGSKDANDVLLKHGPEALREMVRRAKPFPSEGLARPEDMLEELRGWQQDGMPRGNSTGMAPLDELFRVTLGQLTIVSGIPSHGKSEWVDQLIVNLWRLHHWRAIVFSPENYPPSTHVLKLAEKLTRRTFDASVLDYWRSKGFDGELMTEDDLTRAISELQDAFTFILPDIDGDGHDLDRLLEIVEQEVYRTGAKVFVIDPFNEIEHHIPRGESETNYISKCLNRLRRFARRLGIAVFVVAHPTKLDHKPEKFTDASGKERVLMTEPIPRAYDISGSANWFNKADNVVIVWRDKLAEIRGSDPNLNTLKVEKVKLKWAGRGGSSTQMVWDPPTGCYLDPRNNDQDEVANLSVAQVDDILGDDW